MSVSMTTEQVQDVPDTPAITMQELVARFRNGDLSAARPLIDMLGSTLHHVLGQRNHWQFRALAAESELAAFKGEASKPELPDTQLEADLLANPQAISAPARTEGSTS